MPMAKIDRQRVTTSSVPPMLSLTTDGSNDSTTIPTSQNQDTINMPSHSRGSALSDLRRCIVEVQGLRVMTRPGADGVVFGISDANPQQAIASPTMTIDIPAECAP